MSDSLDNDHDMSSDEGDIKVMPDYTVTNNLYDAAAEIQRSSFTVLRLPPSTARKLEEAWREAIKLFHQTPRLEWTRIVQGHLYGYNVPSSAKRLFRAFPFSTDQPWPNDTFRQASRSVADELRKLLMDILIKLHETNSTSQKMQEEKKEVSAIRDKKRKRQHQDPPLSIMENDNTLAVDAARSPLDYFFYHNQEPSAVNCSEHVDRGLLIAVSLTDVPGLEVLVNSTVEESDSWRWTCPETKVYNSRLYEEVNDSSISDLVCIMAGGQLAEAIAADVPACVHRVRQNLKRSRLSISFELRSNSRQQAY